MFKNYFLFSKKFFACLTLIFAFAVSAFADQAIWVTKAQAESAVKLLEHKKQVKDYCAPCGDKSATITEIKSVKLEKVQNEDYWEVKVNGDAIDLAYVYFNETGDKWRNTAIALNIEVTDVPEYLP